MMFYDSIRVPDIVTSTTEPVQRSQPASGVSAERTAEVCH